MVVDMKYAVRCQSVRPKTTGKCFFPTCMVIEAESPEAALKTFRDRYLCDADVLVDEEEVEPLFRSAKYHDMDNVVIRYRMNRQLIL